MPTCGSLFSGVGLLDAGLHLAGWEHAWFCEADEWRRGILAQRFPGAVVYDDVRTVRGPFAADAERDGVRQQPVTVGGRGGQAVAGRAGEAAANAGSLGRNGRPREPREGREAAEWGEAGDHIGDGDPTSAGRIASRVDLIAGGFPCKGASTAGKREGFGHAETVLWHEMRRIIGEVRPRYVLIENVANILGMAAAPGEPAGSLWGTVLGDLAALGASDIRWDCVPAAAVGAPHLRDRVFCVAALAAGEDGERNGDQRRESNGRADVAESGNGAATHADERELRARRHSRRADGVQADTRGVAVQWGDYAPAIQRWEAIHGAAPEPLIRRLASRGADVSIVQRRLDRSEMRAQRQRLSALGDAVHIYVAAIVGAAVMHHYEHGTWG